MVEPLKPRNEKEYLKAKRKLGLYALAAVVYGSLIALYLARMHYGFWLRMALAIPFFILVIMAGKTFCIDLLRQFLYIDPTTKEIKRYENNDSLINGKKDSG